MPVVLSCVLQDWENDTFRRIGNWGRAMKNITLSADENLIEAAHKRARAENSTLNEQFRSWLTTYAHASERMEGYDEVMGQLRGSLKVGRKLTRDEVNER